MQNLSFRFFLLPSPLWQPAIGLRYEVFVVEQKVPEELEIDALDDTAHHLLVQDGDQNCVGVMRIVIKGNVGKIGRVAVAREYRRQGVGAEMMEKALAYCRSLKLASVSLDSQSYITAFYERLGFIREGDEFMDAGIPHVHMSLALAP
ncbi:MAG: GNAT family N-acetyltransferase [Sulfuricella sp.]